MNNSENSDPAAVRAEIDNTRQRMNDTLDALGDRLQPRHLIDEALGYLRNNEGAESRLKEFGQKVSSSAGSVAHSVTDTVKRNPIPTILIGTGIAWMIYQSTRSESTGGDYRDRPQGVRSRTGRRRYDPDVHSDGPLQYPSPLDEGRSEDEPDDWTQRHVLSEGNESGSSEPGTGGEKIGSFVQSARSEMESMRERAGEKLNVAKERARDITNRVTSSTREAYSRARDRVVSTAEHNPLGLGLMVLGIGVIAGLALPTPKIVHRAVGPGVDRLRERTREAGSELLEKGKRIAEAATSAAEAEAEAQGVMPESATAPKQNQNSQQDERSQREKLNLPPTQSI